MEPVAAYMSANDRLHRHDSRRQTAVWREAGRLFARRARVPALRTPVRVVVTAHFADRRRREVSNLFPTYKAIVDGIVDAGILPDDRDECVVGPDPRRGHDPRGGLEVTLIELDPPADTV